MGRQLQNLLSGRGSAIRILGQCARLAPMLALASCLQVQIRGEHPPVAFADRWDFSQSSSYLYGASLDVSGGVCKLRAADQIDDDNSSGGFAGGTLSGLTWDNTGYLRLDPAAPTNVSELDSSWTPHWSNLQFYWKMNGSGAVTSPSIAPDKGAGTCGAWLGTPTYTSGKLNSGIDFGPNGFMQCSGTALNAISNNLSASLWVKASGTLEAWQGIFGATDSGSPQVGWSLANDNGNSLYLSLYTSAQSNANCGFGKLHALDGYWHHIAFTISSGTSTVYMDGRLIETCTYSHGGGIAAPAATPMFANVVSAGTSSIDDFAVWDTVLTPTEIQKIYERQSATYSGRLTSRVIDAFSAGQSWTTFSWTTTFPFLKALPDYSGSIQNESSGQYSSLPTNTLMNGLVGLWHLEEAAGTSGAGTVLDQSGNSRNGTPTGTMTFGVPGRLGSAVTLDGSTGYIDFGNSLSFAGTAPFSTSVWFRVANDGSGAPTLLSKHTAAGGDGWLNFVSGTVVCMTRQVSGVAKQQCKGGNILDGKWHHFAGVYDGTQQILYLDGVASAPLADTTSLITTSTPLKLGWSLAGSYFNGDLDEAAIWSRALSASEIAVLYRRGANRLLFQARNCAAADCSDDPAGANWKGPDGTNQTYFSELYNRSVQSATPGGVFLPGAPAMTFANFTSPIATSRYFQYRAILESDDTGTGCDYGSGATWCSPELKRAQVDPVHYDASGPSVVGRTAAPYRTLKQFTETLGSACAGGVGYNLGIGSDPTTALWFWWDATAHSGAGGWVAADGSTLHSNPATTVSAHLADFEATFGSKNLYFKAYLKSTGLAPCELDQLDLTGTR